MSTLDQARVLVIGGAGLVGSHLVDQLIGEPVQQIVVLDNFARGTRRNLAAASANDKVSIVKGDINDRSHLRELMEGTDIVFLLAALWLGQCVESPRNCVQVNVLGNFEVLEAARQSGVKKLVYSSSASVYGDALAKPMTEEHPLNNRTMYGAAKIAVEQFLRAYHTQYGLDYVAFRYMNIYGPRMDDRGTYVSVIMKVLDRIDQGLPPIIFGDGTQSYDFVHVSDVARANILGACSEATDECFNIGMGVETTINDLVMMLLELTGSDLQPEYRPMEQMFVSHRVGSTHKSERLLGFKAQIPLREGLRQLVAWRAEDRAQNQGGNPR